jgi:hypothetical protein
MKTCNIIGCTCQGTGDTEARGYTFCPSGHRPMKAWEGGFVWYVARYGDRWDAPLGTFVSLSPFLVAKAADEAAKQYSDDMRCVLESPEVDNPHPEGSCGLHGCLICDIQVWTGTHYQTREIFTPAQLRQHRRALLRGEVIHLPRE